MSHPTPSTHLRKPSQPSKEIYELLKITPEILQNEQRTAQKVKEILTIQEEQAKKIIGSTTRTAYRRVHEVVASALDRLAEAKQLDSSLYPDLSKALILAEYQYARKQISEGIANFLKDVITAVLDAATKGDDKSAKKMAKNGRTLLDSVAVLVYMYTRDRSKEQS